MSNTLLGIWNGFIYQSGKQGKEIKHILLLKTKYFLDTRKYMTSIWPGTMYNIHALKDEHPEYFFDTEKSIQFEGIYRVNNRHQCKSFVL